MKKSWVNGLEDDKATAVRSDFQGSFILRDRLKTLLEDKIRISTNVSRSKEGYASPSWAYQQADSVGYERALNEVIVLIFEDSD